MNYNIELKNGPVSSGRDVNHNRLHDSSLIFFLGSSYSEVLHLSRLHYDFVKCSPLRMKIIVFRKVDNYNPKRLIKVSIKE